MIDEKPLKYKICKNCRHRVYEDGFPYGKEGFDIVVKTGYCLDCECDRIDKQNTDISDANGVFFCQKCNVRTNQKTPKTTCVNCGTPLIRMGDN